MSLRRARILVIDDDPDVLRAVERILSADHEVAITGSAEGAPDLARKFRPHLAIVDVVLPETDGFQLVERLKSEAPDLDIIAMTGYPTESRKLLQALQQHAFYFVQKPFDRQSMKTLVERCLRLRWMSDELKVGEKYRREIEHARVLQQGLLPFQMTRAAGLSLAARYRPRFHVSGDFFDYADVGDHVFAAMIADVTGHGFEPAMLTAVIKSAFQSSHLEQFEPLAVIRRVAANLGPCRTHHFVSMIAIRVKPRGRGRVLEYVNAGHPAGLMWGNAWPPVALTSTGPIVSPAPELRSMEFEMRHLPFRENDRLLLYTDGVTDTVGPDGFYGEERLHDVIGSKPAGGEGLLDAIVESVERFADGREPSDDVTLVTLRGS